MATNFKRKENWSKEEVSTLVDTVKELHSVLTGRFTPTLTHEKRSRAWQEVSDRVNAVCVTQTVRSPRSCKKKWQTLTSNVRAKEATRMKEGRGTGGGPAPVGLDSLETCVLSTIPKSMVRGIDGGIDTEEGEVDISSITESASETTDVFTGSSVDGHITITACGDAPTSQRKLPIVQDMGEACSDVPTTITATNRKRSIKKDMGGACGDAPSDSKRKRSILQDIGEDMAYKERYMVIEEKKIELMTRQLELDEIKVSKMDKIAESIQELTLTLKQKYFADNFFGGQ